MTDRALIPVCLNCGESVFPNVRIDNSFIGDHLEITGEECRNWVDQVLDKRGVILEIGAGYITPSIIRWSNERIVHFSLDWRIIRINRDHPQVPESIEDRAVCIADDVGDTFAGLTLLVAMLPFGVETLAVTIVACTVVRARFAAEHRSDSLANVT